MSVYYLLIRCTGSVHLIIDLVAIMVFNRGYVDETGLYLSVTVLFDTENNPSLFLQVQIYCCMKKTL